MKPIATGRLTHAAGKYAEHAPTATACCMTCRTCVTSNLIGVAAVPFVAAVAWLRRRTDRGLDEPSS